MGTTTPEGVIEELKQIQLKWARKSVAFWKENVAAWERMEHAPAHRVEAQRARLADAEKLRRELEETP
jgi:hypothetical protein